MIEQPGAYNVFISWSGERSLAAATALRKWLPMVIQRAIPWMSANDIEKGEEWQRTLTDTLSTVKIGIVCLTPENLNSHWLLFEAGAIAKEMTGGKARLCPYLLAGLRMADIQKPLGMFQGVGADEVGTKDLVKMLNTRLEGRMLEQTTLDTLFESLWPRLKTELEGLSTMGDSIEPRRTTEDMVAEILEVVRHDGLERARQRQMVRLLRTSPGMEFPNFRDVVEALDPTYRDDLIIRAGSPEPLKSTLPLWRRNADVLLNPEHTHDDTGSNDREDL